MITAGAWDAGGLGVKMKWGRDATSIRVPKVGGWFPRFLDLGNGKDVDRITAGTASIPGSEQASQNKTHNHINGTFNKLLKVDGVGTGIAFDNDPTNTQPNLTSAGTILAEGGIESRGENGAWPGLIYI